MSTLKSGVRGRLENCLEDPFDLFVHLLYWGDENDFDPFFHLKCAKWDTPGTAGAARRRDGNATTGRCTEPRSTRAGGQDYVSS